MSLDGVIREVWSHEDVRVIRISLERDGARSNGTLTIAAEEAGPSTVTPTQTSRQTNCDDD
jgi:hypothetical protein